MTTEIINPITYPEWDRLVSAYKNSTFFHTSVWARVLHETYGYKPLYFTKANGTEPGCIVPVMEVKSRYTGTRGVSLPFTDFCGLLSKDPAINEQVIKDVFTYGRLKRWKYVEFRGDIKQKEEPVASESYLIHVLDLSGGEEEVFKKFKSSTRRNIRKAKKQGVKVEIRNDAGGLNEYYRLHTITRKRHGLPPQPQKFFSKIHEHIISREKGFVVLAKHGSEYIAGGVYFYFGANAIYKYGASDKAFQHLRGNNLVMWEAIRWFMDQGFKTFHFGRTDPGNKGLARFKRGWGTREEALKYHKFDFKKSTFVDSTRNGEHSYPLFRYLPDCLCRQVGSLVYKHIG